MKQFDKRSLTVLRNKLDALLADFAEENNLELKIGNIKFSETEFKATLEGRIKGAAGREDSLLNMLIMNHNLVKVNSAGDQLVSYKRNNHKYPFIYVKKSDGRRYKGSLEHIVALFRNNE